MYTQFLEKEVKLVYEDGEKLNKPYVRYVKGKVVETNKKSMTIQLMKSSQLFAVSLSQIVYVKELGSLGKEKRTGG
jgi:hypothetical protein